MGAGRGHTRRTRAAAASKPASPQGSAAPNSAPAVRFARGEQAVFTKRVERPVLNNFFTRQSGDVCTIGVPIPDPNDKTRFLYTVSFDGTDDSLIAYPEELSAIPPTRTESSTPPMRVEDLQKIEW